MTARWAEQEHLCAWCERWIIPDGAWCPVCGHRLPGWRLNWWEKWFTARLERWFRWLR